MKHLFYIKFDQIHKKSEYNTFAIIAKDVNDALMQGEKIGTNPQILSSHALSAHWA